MKNWTIARRIIAGYAATIAITLTLGLFAHHRLVAIHGHATTITTHSLPSIYLIGQVESRARMNYRLTLEHLLADNDQARADFTTAIAANKTAIDQIFSDYESHITTQRDRELWEVVKTTRAAYVRSFHEVLKLSDEKKNKEAVELTRRVMLPVFEKFMQAIEDEVEFNKANGDAAGAGITTAVASAQTGIVVGLISALAASAALAFFIINGTNRVLTFVTSAISDGAEQTAAASGQVAAASQQLAEGASEQAASLEETSASLEEMTSMVKRNAEAAGKAKSLANETRAAADTGSADIGEMKNAMNEIKASSSEVAKIVKDIDEIAFQTNILALNAAVEAARAGEAGMGFAVVADEVRNLAQRSARSAKETATKIEDAIAKSERGVQISNRVAVSFEQIATKTREVDQYVAEIASASNEQAQGVSQVNTAVTQMDKVTQSNAASAEECASAAEELSSQAASVKESVQTLQQLVGGAASRRKDVNPTAPAPVERPAARRPAAPSMRPRFPAATVNGGHKTPSAAATAGVVSNGSSGSFPMPEKGDFRSF